ncbi:Fe(3+) ABC transporter substrate-binding protein [Sporomusa sp.]|uniref:Fe(3+) ABC transporter substrate-binding protein n=1 Tax=Sporomusa sp. TaxID=2078658 RepID=UPI002BB6377F|nr:Fe(3+) ABC transporter substrate-binding protein [Sporomusa sp.]HWR42012.1 Fe(3+) ABC transporter substrate-binding protein [Sporomusa sp.]
MKKPITLMLSLLMSASLVFAGCASTKQSAAPQNSQPEAKEVNVYTARHYPGVDDAIYKAFTDKTGIKVNLIKASGEELIQRIKTEGNSSKADIYITSDAGNLYIAKEAGLLQPANSPILEKNIPANFIDKDKMWVGLTMRARVLVYAKDRVNKEDLSTYEDLTDARWKGRILTRSSNNIYNQSMLASFIELNGEAKAKEWAKGIVGNLAMKPEGGDRDQAKAVAAGKGDVAIMNSYYLGQMLTSKDPEEVKAAEKLSVFFPNQNTTGTHVNVSGAGIVKTSQNVANAVKLLEFLSEAEAQKTFAEASTEYPVNPSVEPSALLKAWGPFKKQDINLSKLGENNKKAVQLFNEVGWK